MRKGDFVWGGILLLFLGGVLLEPTHSAFIGFTTTHPYLGGFFKFALLATMGEMLVTRLEKGYYSKAAGFIYRVLVWGGLGIAITLIFQIFAAGTMVAIDSGYLIGKGNTLAFAFFTSGLLNLTFAPTMMGFHKFTDAYLDLKYGDGIAKPSSKQVVDKIDWQSYVSFILFKTIPFFWIPAHTITFLLPGEYRVLAAALLSMALGLLLTMSKRKK